MPSVLLEDVGVRAERDRALQRRRARLSGHPFGRRQSHRIRTNRFGCVLVYSDKAVTRHLWPPPLHRPDINSQGLTPCARRENPSDAHEGGAPVGSASLA